MPLKIFAEIPIDIDRSFNFNISNPQNGDAVASSMVVEGSFELKNQPDLVNRIIENSQSHPDFDAYMNDIIRCSRRSISKDENVSVGFDEEYKLTSFQVNAFDDPNVDNLKKISFECVVENLEEGINFLWFSFQGNIFTGSHVPIQYQIVKLNCDVTKSTKKITAEFTPSNHSLMETRFFSAIYNTTMDVANKRSDSIDTNKNYDEFTEFMNPNKSVMYSWADHLMQCVLKRIGGKYIIDLTQEELERFEIRLEINSYNGGVKNDRRSLEGLEGILCTPDYYQLVVNNENKEVLLFQEMIPKNFAKGMDKIRTRFVIYYDYEKVGWSNWHEIRITDKRVNPETGKSTKEKQELKKDSTNSIWKKFWNSIFGTNDLKERVYIDSVLTSELKSIGAVILNDKIILAEVEKVLNEKLIAERKNSSDDPKNADQNFVGNTNQLIEMFTLIWKSMTYGSQNYQMLPDLLKLNKKTPK